MTRVSRVDYSKIQNIQKTPQGGLKIPAYLTRTGVFTYHDATSGKEIKEYRPPEEVFKADSLEMLRGAPLTHDHPPEQVAPVNFRTYAIGHVADDVKSEGDKIGATLYVQDDQAIRSVEAGRREISCGYHVDVDDTPGTTPEGLPYDRVQRNIQYNHVALVPDGRAGHDVRLRLDSNENQITGEKEMDAKKTELIGGVEYEVGSDAHRAARSRHDSAVAKNRKTFTEMTELLSQAEARADAAEEKLNKFVEAVKQQMTPERLDRMVRTRTAIVSKAQRLLGQDFKCDGMSNLDIKAEVVKQAFPKIRLDGKDAAYISGLFRGASEKATRNDSMNVTRKTATAVPFNKQAVTGTRTFANVRQDMMDAEASRSRRPLAISRRDMFKPLSSHPMLQRSQLEVEK